MPCEHASTIDVAMQIGFFFCSWPLKESSLCNCTLAIFVIGTKQVPVLYSQNMGTLGASIRILAALYYMQTESCRPVTTMHNREVTNSNRKILL